MIEQETICPHCKQTKFWLREDEPTKYGCPICTMRFIGVYNKRTGQLEPRLYFEKVK